MNHQQQTAADVAVAEILGFSDRVLADLPEDLHLEVIARVRGELGIWLEAVKAGERYKPR